MGRTASSMSGFFPRAEPAVARSICSCRRSALRLYRPCVPKPPRAKSLPSFPGWPEILEAVEPLIRARVEHVAIAHGNSLEVLDILTKKFPDGCFDCIFADPPYFLSNGGITCHAGRMVKVDKGEWDKSQGAELNHEFNTEWLRRCQRVLKP